MSIGLMIVSAGLSADAQSRQMPISRTTTASAAVIAPAPHPITVGRAGAAPAPARPVVTRAEPRARSIAESPRQHVQTIEAHLQIMDNTAQVRGLKARLQKLPRDYALVIHKTDTHALLLTKDGFRFARAARPTHDPIERPRYNGTMYTTAWVETWKVPFVAAGTKRGALETIAPAQLRKRLDDLAAKPSWGEPNAWNPVSGNSGGDVALYRRTVVAR